jgi:hypothetical protein
MSEARAFIDDARAFAVRYNRARMLVSDGPDLLRPMPVLQETRPGLHPAPSREPCKRCNIRGDIGCKHQAPFVAGEMPSERLNSQGHRIFARHRPKHVGEALL